MITLQELSKILDSLMQVPGLVDYCPNGIHVEGQSEIRKIGMGVSASLATIEQAIALNCQALIVHHGLFWNKDEYPLVGSKKKKLALMLNHGISLIAYHLPLDIHVELGNNWKAAKDMSWSDLKPFGFMNKTPLGVQGKIPRQSCQAFKEKLEEYYQHPASIAWGGKEMIESVGLISGGAHRSILDAAKEGLDCFITGSFDEPTWHQAFEEKINFFALGHSATERVGPQALGAYLQSTLGIECPFIDIPNPF